MTAITTRTTKRCSREPNCHWHHQSQTQTPLLPVATVVTITRVTITRATTTTATTRTTRAATHTDKDSNRNSRHSTDQRAEHAVNGAAYASVFRLSCLQHTQTFTHIHTRRRVCLVSSSFGQLMTAATITTTRELATLLAVLCSRRRRRRVANEVCRIPWPSLLLANS